MSKRERRIEEYRDGGLSRRKRREVESWLEQDPESSAEFRRLDSLGGTIRDAWNDAPRPPAPEYLISALRPKLAQIDAERRRRSWPVKLIDAIGPWLRPAPIATLAATAALVLLVLARLEPAVPAGDDATLAFAGATLEFPSAIYDLDSGDNPLMVFEGDDESTIIWLFEDEGPEGVSWQTFRGDDWV